MFLMTFSKKCERCGLRYPEDEETCSHCRNMSDGEVVKLKDEHQKQLSRVKLKAPYLLSVILLTFSVIIWFLFLAK